MDSDLELCFRITSGLLRTLITHGGDYEARNYLFNLVMTGL